MKKLFLVLFIIFFFIFAYKNTTHAADCGDGGCGFQIQCDGPAGYDPCDAQGRTCINPCDVVPGGECQTASDCPNSSTAEQCGADRACSVGKGCSSGICTYTCFGTPPCGGGGPAPTSPTGTSTPCPNPDVPYNMSPVGTFSAGSYTFTWSTGANTTSQNIYIKNQTTSIIDPNGASVPVAANSSYGPVTLQAGNTYSWWVTAHNGTCSQVDSAVNLITATAAPNCTTLTGPSTLLVGDTGSYSAIYQNGGGSVTSVSMKYLGASSACATAQNLTSSPQSVGAGTYSFDWTPAAAGSYYLYCQATNSNTIPATECLGMCTGSSPPQYTCTGPNAYTAVPVTVNNPSAWWYKTKDASLYKTGNIDLQVLSSVTKFTAGDTDDTTNRAIIIGNAGVGLTDGNFSTGPSYNPMPISSNGWIAGSYSWNPVFLNVFMSYVKSRKEYATISAVDNTNVVQNKINIILGNQTITSDSFTSKAPFILIVRNADDTDYGNVTIDVDNFNNDGSGNPKGSIAIIAKNITFSGNVQYADGIFIAQTSTIDTLGGGPDKLKIKGNLISSSAVQINRASADLTKPTLFVVAYPTTYLDLLPYLSITSYEEIIH